MTGAGAAPRTDPAHARPAVTVVVPVYEDVDRLRTCLRLLADQDYAGSLDVVVADNGSRTDLRPALPEGDARFRLVREERPGSYAARNAAVAVATGEVLAFTDADCRPHPGWVSRAVAALHGPTSPDAVGGRIRLVFRHGPGPVTGPELYEEIHDFDQRSDVLDHHFAATANLVVRRAVLDRVGPFDATLKSGGDLEWGGRLHAAGGTLHYADDAVVDHPSRASWGELTRKAARVGRGLASLSDGDGLAGDLRFCAAQARATVREVVVSARERRPAGPAARVRYLAAFGWTRAVWCVVRVRRRLAPRSAAAVRE